MSSLQFSIKPFVYQMGMPMIYWYDSMYTGGFFMYPAKIIQQSYNYAGGI